eukprot:4074806-Prymnesium_polylepis.1
MAYAPGAPHGTATAYTDFLARLPLHVGAARHPGFRPGESTHPSAGVFKAHTPCLYIQPLELRST